MVMVGQHRRLAQPLRWGRRERLAVGGVLALLSAGVIALVVFAAVGGRSATTGCIDASFASTTGGAHLHACGARARAVCSHTLGGASRDRVAEAVAAACRRAGYPLAAAAARGGSPQSAQRS
jgi:hypothetical protein